MVGQTLAGLDLFFDAGPFARQWPKLLRAHAVEAYRQSSRPDEEEPRLRARVQALLAAATGVEGAVRENAGEGVLFEFRAKGLRGSALVFDGRVVHAAVL